MSQVAGVVGTATVGHAGLLAAVAGAGWAAWCGVRGRRGSQAALAVAAVGAVVAAAALGWALVTDDYSLIYVAEHARRGASAPYRLAGLWGGMAGSLSLWLAMLALVAVLAGRAGGARVGGLLGLVVAGFGGVLLVLADPFDRLSIPALDGQGLQPVLEHPAMLYHPPLLYAGLVSLAAPFALAVAAAWDGSLDGALLARLRRWAVVPWALLGVGMVAGAHWAYVELGWGGYWAWDPIENTALLPWLALTAALHLIVIGRTRAAAAAVAGAFVLAVLGTTLTRSGAAPSVHAFAEDPAAGWALLALTVALAAGAALALARAPRAPRSVGHYGRLSTTTADRTAVGGQVGLVLGVLVVVLVGTLFPLLAEATGGDAVAVDGRYFARFTAPLAVGLLALLVYAWRDGRRPGALAGGVGLVIALVAGWREPFPLAVAALGTAAAASSVVMLVRRRRPGHLAHLGVAVLLIGVAGTATGASTAATLAPGESLRLRGWEVRNEGVAVVDEHTVRANVTLLRGGDAAAQFEPTLVVHRERGSVVAVASLRSTVLNDVQVLLRDADDDGRALLVVHVAPLMLWVWWGALLLVAAGAWAWAVAPSRHQGGIGRRRFGQDSGNASEVLSSRGSSADRAGGLRVPRRGP